MFSIRRLGPGDEAVLARLAVEDPDYDLDERSEPSEPLPPEKAARYLANPAVLHWVAEAEEDRRVLGFLYCLHLPLRCGEGEEVFLYEIGVHKAHRRAGVGRALMGEMEAWMREREIGVVWVLADNAGAVAFYRATAFAVEGEQPVYMTRELDLKG